MIARMLNRLKLISPWHFVWISIVISELITAALSTAQGRLYWGRVPTETLIIGAVDALVVPLIVASVVVYFLKHTAELNRMNIQLQEANRKLLEIDRMKTDFISVVSHELRTPLTTIKAFTELIIMKPDMEAQRKGKLVSIINIETDRLTRLINDLLDLARIEAGSLKFRADRVSLEEVVMSSIAGMGPLFENKHISLKTRFDSPGATVIGDRDRLVQVVTNLLSNAGKFTPTGGAVLAAVWQESGPEEQVVVAITDTGIGIPAADIEMIFEKFHRSGDQLTSTIEGTGLGLAIARQIVEAHGGRIRAESVQGKGSTFKVVLPIRGTNKGQGEAMQR